MLSILCWLDKRAIHCDQRTKNFATIISHRSWHIKVSRHYRAWTNGQKVKSYYQTILLMRLLAIVSWNVALTVIDYGQRVYCLFEMSGSWMYLLCMACLKSDRNLEIASADLLAPFFITEWITLKNWPCIKHTTLLKRSIIGHLKWSKTSGVLMICLIIVYNKWFDGPEITEWLHTLTSVTLFSPNYAVKK